MLLGIVFAAMTFSSLVLYAVVLARLKDRFAADRLFAETIEAMTGTLLIGLGVRIAAEQR